MKKYSCILIALLSQCYVIAQNTGIGTTNPVQQLDVNGAIKIGNTGTNAPGTIRYNNNNFEGGDGNSWRSLEALPSKAIIVAQEPDTAFLKTKGFSVLRQMDIWDTSYISVPVNQPGSWTNGFPLSSGSNPAAYMSTPETVFHNGRFIYYGNDGYLYAYTVSTQLWSQLPNVSPLGARTACGMTLVGNEIFITGGWKYVLPNFVIYNTAAKYNLSTNSWTNIANMPVTNCYHATIAAGTDLYMLNGASTFDGSQFVTAKKLYRYNTVSNTWSADLSTASTPGYATQGGTVGRNGKYLFNSSVYNSGGNNYISISEFDPATQSLTAINPSAPWPFTTPVSFRYSIPLPTTSDKVLVMGYIPDSTDIDYNSGNPLNTSASRGVLYEVSLTTGIATALNVCGPGAQALYTWQYNAADGLVYAKTDNSYFVFNPSGSQSCNIVLKRRGYWSYMKKN
ncbi:MAG: hypothetical protein QM687_09770 [Ferruginibacter sp.]